MNQLKKSKNIVHKNVMKISVIILTSLTSMLYLGVTLLQNNIVTLMHLMYL